MDGSSQVKQQQDSDLYFVAEFDGDAKAGLVVRSFHFDEGVSQVPTLHLELSSGRKDIDLASLLDKPAVLTISDRYSDTKRYVHGVVSEIESGDIGAEFTRYRATIRPTIHRLGYETDCRIYQNQTVIQIVESIFKERGVEHYDFQINDDHPPREMCNMFNETYLGFIERILADEGYLYFFSFEQDKHTLHITDASYAATDCEHARSLEYNDRPGGDTKEPYVQRFSWRETTRSSKASYRDNVFTHPTATLAHESSARRSNGLTRELDSYAYPGRYKAEKTGATWARYQLDALRSDASCGTGYGRCAHLTPGHTFELKEHDNKKLNQHYFVVSVTQEGSQPAAEEEAAPAEGGTHLHTHFQVVTHDTHWRPKRHAKPLVEGPHYGIVTGPDGEEIFVDNYGRIKIYLHWDRHAQKQDDTTSCWVRVASNWAGAMYGQISHPRIGQHVLVSFVGGDCDQMIVTGRYYNADHLPPYKLPDNKTKMTIKSKSHKAEGFNELTFEDEAGQENYYMHAQKDMNVEILNDRNKSVNHDQTEKIGNDKTINVGGNHTETIDLNKMLTVLMNMNRMVGMTSSEEVGIMKNTIVGVTQVVTVGRTKSEEIGKHYSLTVGDTFDISVGKQFTITCGQSKFTMKADGTITKTGVHINHNASEAIQITGKVVDLN